MWSTRKWRDFLKMNTLRRFALECGSVKTTTWIAYLLSTNSADTIFHNAGSCEICCHNGLRQMLCISINSETKQLNCVEVAECAFSSMFSWHEMCFICQIFVWKFFLLYIIKLIVVVVSVFFFVLVWIVSEYIFLYVKSVWVCECVCLWVPSPYILYIQNKKNRTYFQWLQQCYYIYCLYIPHMCIHIINIWWFYSILFPFIQFQWIWV